MSRADGPEVVVVGSANIDLVLHVGQLPRPGETVLGQSLLRLHGGKGANQAVAAARLGSRVTFLGCVGGDGDGDDLLAAMRSDGVDVSGVRRSEQPSGLACVTVGEHGENTIVVTPGANSDLRVDDVTSSAEALATAKVVLLQLEVPQDTVDRAIALARGVTILNPAPAAVIDDALLAGVDILIPNRVELGALLQTEPPTGLDETAQLVRRLPGRVVIVTMGAEGALICEAGRLTPVSAPRIQPVDTTGAGDAFCGAVADGIAHGMDLGASVTRAVRAASASTLRAGARASLPGATEVDALLAPATAS